MNTFTSIIIALYSITSIFSERIAVTIIFENFSDKTAISGVFYISETNQRLEINSLEPFTITLPKKGRYQFEFYSEDVKAFIYYPTKITKRKNTVTIRLENRTNNSEAISVPIKDISNFSNEQIEDGINNGTINFIVHGLTALSPDAIKLFKDVYGIGFISENCVIDPMSYRTAINTNKRIEAYLNYKFGEDWQNKLPAPPFGL
ncbi:FEKKY domain-containing protein [Gelidibacter maritimus]|uniref:Uncharacterized protein n=1 Tax=Gelidibacter maritimus TaxID=2761487 RepID=A0A7W2M2U3_9FLAO|nr:hypothetical protein [Gelidibacter maritimus]MBA6151702.1 hypothetical protein [Gelidibacter maritimus]